MGRIEDINALNLRDFRARFFPDLRISEFDLSSHALSLSVSIEPSASIAQNDLDSCISLVERTSSDMYKNSSIGWSLIKKRKEMTLPEMYYVLVKESGELEQIGETHSHGSLVKGFLSFMFTYEDGQEVVYCYELHLDYKLRGIGLGKELMSFMESAATRAGVHKVMLTVFCTNQDAMQFYTKLGYSEDECSPAPKVLRNGKVKPPSYAILSKMLAS